MRRVWLSLLLLLAATAPVRAEDQERPAHVRAVEWSGLEAVPAGDLEERVLTEARGWRLWREPRPFDQGTLLEDVDRILGLYRARGFYEARVEPELLWSDDRTAVTVRFCVAEGESVQLREFTVELPDEFEEREGLQTDLPLVLGEPFGSERYIAAREQLLERLGNRGRPDARLAGGAEVDLAARTARVRWQLEPGPRVTLGETTIVGLVDVEEGLVRRELDYRAGDLFSADALERSRRRLYALGLFRSVALQPLRPERPGGDPEPPPAQATWPLEIRVEERPPRSVRFGVGWGTEDQVRVAASWVHRNLYGGLRRVELGARYSSLVAGLQGDFRQPRFLDDLTTLQADAGVRRETEPAFRADRAGVGVALERVLGGPWTGRLGYGLAFDRVLDFDAEESGAVEDAEKTTRLASLRLGLRRAAVDDPLEPTRGTWFDVALEPTARALGSEVDFVRLLAEGRAFLPLGPTVLALRLRAGSIDPFGSTAADEVPVTQRFFSGGSTSVRGFDYQKLGPLDDDDDPIGGLTLVEATSELRFPIWRSLGGVVFADAGQLALRPWDVRGSDIFYSAGGGLRYRTPLGPLRLDLGYVLNPPDGIDRFRVHVSVGHAF